MIKQLIYIQLLPEKAPALSLRVTRLTAEISVNSQVTGPP